MIFTIKYYYVGAYKFNIVEQISQCPYISLLTNVLKIKQ